MSDFLDKLSSYNLFNYLLPGILFVILSKEFVGYNYIQENNIIGVFLYYFIGMTISRFGSLIIEPFLKLIHFINFSDYINFVKASKQDSKIDLLSEVNNTYRTLISMTVLLLLSKAYQAIQLNFGITRENSILVILLLVLLLFLLSYRKQTDYITKRINLNH